MKITPVCKLSDSLQLTRYGLVNCYLVSEGDSFTLIDASFSGWGNQIIAAAAAAQKPIQRILLTHAHPDHIGSVDAILAKLGPLEIATSQRSVPLLRRPADRSIQAGELHKPIRNTPGINSPVTRILSEGDCCGSLRVIETPGHLPGHLSFLDERDGTLYAGDVVVGVNGLRVAGRAPWYSAPTNLFTWDRELALASARKLLDYPIIRFATGHMPVREGGLNLLRATLAKVDSGIER